MTKTTKCDICRQRKIKCDERRPQCSQCRVKDRSCSYHYGTAPRFVHVNRKHGASDTSLIDRRNDAEQIGKPLTVNEWQSTSGPSETKLLSIRSEQNRTKCNVAFYTCTMISLPKSPPESGVTWEDSEPNQEGPERRRELYRLRLQRSPASLDASLQSRLIAVLGPKSTKTNAFFLWGSWITLLPARIGTSRALDEATLCFLAGTVAYRNRNEANVKIARAQYSNALKSLQGALYGSEDQRFSSQMLAAVKLLSTFEMLLGLRTNTWVSHCRGLVELFVARGAGANQDDIDRSIFYSTFLHECIEAILNGTDSAFDSKDWLQFPPPDEDGEPAICRMASNVIMQQMVRIPRLVRLLRRFRQSPSNISLALETVELAEKLYNNKIDTMITRMLHQNTRRVPTESPDLVSYFPESLVYDGVNVFDTIMCYCYCRIMIIGLCRKLIETFPSVTLNSASLAEADIQAATYIAQSIQYAENLTDPMPLGPLFSVMPLQFAFGAWWRAQRLVSSSPKLRKMAVFMKQWTTDKSNEMLRKWSGQECSMSRLEIETAAFEGGPYMEWMQRKIRPL